jgi:hypothetical protein
MTDQPVEVTGGVETHGETHYAAVIDRLGRHLADREFAATGTAGLTVIEVDRPDRKMRRMKALFSRSYGEVTRSSLSPE